MVLVRSHPENADREVCPQRSLEGTCPGNRTWSVTEVISLSTRELYKATASLSSHPLLLVLKENNIAHLKYHLVSLCLDLHVSASVLARFCSLERFPWQEQNERCCAWEKWLRWAFPCWLTCRPWHGSGQGQWHPGPALSSHALYLEEPKARGVRPSPSRAGRRASA